MMQRKNSSESGMAMITVVVLLAALLAVGAVSLQMQLNSTKSAAHTKQSREALYCAEAGLATARNVLVSNMTAWNIILDPAQTNPVWYPITGDMDGDGQADYQVAIRDDGDDLDLTQDTNQTIIVESTCIKYPSAPASVIEVIGSPTSGTGYRNQSGQGAGNTGNAN